MLYYATDGDRRRRGKEVRKEGRRGRVDESGVVVAHPSGRRPSSLVTHTTMSRKSKTRAQTHKHRRGDEVEIRVVILMGWILSSGRKTDSRPNHDFPDPTTLYVCFVSPPPHLRQEGGRAVEREGGRSVARAKAMGDSPDNFCCFGSPQHPPLTRSLTHSLTHTFQ